MKKQQIIQAIKSQTLKDTLITLTGSGIGALFSVFFYVIAARNLKPQDFGYLSLMWSVTILIMDMFDLPINNSLIRFVSHFRSRKDYQGVASVVRLTVKLKIVLSFFVGIAFILFAKPLAGLVFKQESLSILFIVSGVFFFAAVLFRFTSSLLLAWQRYVSRALFVLAGDGLRLVLVLFISLTGMLSLSSVVAVSFLAFLIVSVLSLFFLPKQIYIKPTKTKTIKGFWHFNWFMTAVFVIAAFHSRLDQFFLVRLSTPLQLGLYAASARVTIYIQQVSGTLSSVLAPKFAARSEVNVGRFFIKTMMLTLFAGLSLIIFIPVASELVKLIFGPNYLGSVASFQILLLANAIFLVSVPLSSIIIYHFSAVHFLLFLSILQLISQVSINWFLVPRWGAVGSAFAWLFTSTLSLILMASFVFFQFKQHAYSSRHR